MAIVGRPDLNNYRLRLEATQESLIPTSKSDPYQIGGTAHFPQWFNTITLSGVASSRIGAMQDTWQIEARCFLARGTYSDTQYATIAEQADADVITVVTHFRQPNFEPFIIGAYTDSQPGFIPQSVTIEATSPATYPVRANSTFMGSTYTIRWQHWINYRA